MKLLDLFEAMKPIPSDYDKEYDAILKKLSPQGNRFSLPAHLSHLNRNSWYGSTISTQDLQGELAKLSDTDIMLFLISHPTDFQYIPNPSDAVIKFALRHNGMNLKYLTKMGIPMTDEYIKIAVRENGRAIGWVNKPTEDQMIRAVSKTSQAIHNIIKPYSKKLTPGEITPAVLATADKKNSTASTNVLVKHGKLESDEVTSAIKKNASTILHIKHPTPEQVELALSVDPMLTSYLIRSRLPVSNERYVEYLKQNPSQITMILEFPLDPATSNMLIKHALTNQSFVDATNAFGKHPYDAVVAELFRDNTMLAKKWIRYGETMRSAS
jgi:hypothetical protein